MKKISLLLLLCLMSASVWADALVGKFSDDDLIRIIKTAGYGVPDKYKEGVIRIKEGETIFVVFNKPDGDLQLYYSVGGLKVTCEDMNEWNRTHRLSRAYLDKENDPTLESDLLSNAGMTEKHVTETFNVFKMSVAAFREFLAKQSRR